MKKKFKERNQYGAKKTKKTEYAEGFSFVETLAVIAITTALAAGSSVSVSKLINMAKRTSAQNQIEQLSAAIQAYFLDCGRFPTTEQGIQALWECPILYPVPENWNGPYLNRKPEQDPWGTNFIYLSAESSTLPVSVPENIPFVLLSYGADKKEGGTGNGADLYSWQ